MDQIIAQMNYCLNQPQHYQSPQGWGITFFPGKVADLAVNYCLMSRDSAETPEYVNRFFKTLYHFH